MFGITSRKYQPRITCPNCNRVQNLTVAAAGLFIWYSMDGNDGDDFTCIYCERLMSFKNNITFKLEEGDNFLHI